MAKTDRREFVRNVSIAAVGISLSGAKASEGQETPMAIEDAAATKSNCETCSWRRYAERKPKSIRARLWRWHTTWCPGWKAYQRELAKKGARRS